MPYGDPNDPHYRKNAFDAGEDGLGKNAHSLKKVSTPFTVDYPSVQVLCTIDLFV